MSKQFRNFFDFFLYYILKIFWQLYKFYGNDDIFMNLRIRHYFCQPYLKVTSEPIFYNQLLFSIRQHR